MVFAVLFALVGCGAARTGGGATSRTGSLEALWRAPGEDVAIVAGTSDYAPGLNRVSFLVVRHDGSAVFRPRARVLVAKGLKERPFLRTTATLEPVGVPGASKQGTADVSQVYVAHVRLPGPGRYTLLAVPVGGSPIQAIGTLQVGRHAVAPEIGATAYPSRTPTLASTHGRLGLLTTRTPPDRALLRYSVADSLRAHVPFVVAFATPKFCESRTCGPVVDVVDAVRKRLAGNGVRFIHVEIYRRNDVSLGPNRWVKEWHLPSEPFVFLVGRDGRIAGRFEGSVSVAELEAAVRHDLLS